LLEQLASAGRQPHDPIEQIRTAVELQAGRHVKGKVVIDL
jgi:hypothetical protein